MHYKPDFENIIPRMKAWWQGELLDRVAISVTAPNGRPPANVPAPPSLKARWLDIDYVINAAEARMDATYFGGDAIPVLQPNLGPDLFAALCGGTIEYREDTSWVAPFLDWDNPPSFSLDTTSFEWRWHEAFYEKARERSSGRYLLAAPDCHSGGDALLAMRGGNDLCLDLYDRPEDIKRAMRKLETAVKVFHEGFRPLIESTGQEGHTTSWLRVWSPGYSNVVQLDLLALISPDMFREFFFHELEVQCEVLDYVAFHLDGPDAIRHLPIVCEIPEVRAIQWVPGAGNGPMTKWIPLLKKIQELGKGVHVSCEPNEVETLLKELSSKGLFIHTRAETPEAAEELVKIAAKHTHE